MICAALLLAMAAAESLGTCNPNETGADCPPEQPGDLALFTGTLPVLAGCILVGLVRPARWSVPAGIALAVLGVAVAALVTS